MGQDSAILQKAISQIDHECSYLSAEQAAFEEFRESVRLATPEPTAIAGSSETTEHLKETYPEKVIDRLDYNLVYGDSLGESLEQELSPTTADTLLSKDPFTQRLKRKLLVETTAAIERREQFLAELDEERNALKTFVEELADIESSVERLPACSLQQQPLEELLEIWEQYNMLEKRCKCLLERRQEQIRDAKRSVRIFGDQHTLNDFLYGELETSYPVLTALAATVERINLNRMSVEWSEMMDRPKTC